MGLGLGLDLGLGLGLGLDLGLGLGLGLGIDLGLGLGLGLSIDLGLAISDKVFSMINDKEVEMKRLVDVQGEGLESLLGELVTLWCECYIYAGKLVGVNDEFVLLEEAGVVYETGSLTSPGFKDVQRLPGPWYIRVAKIESFGKMS